MHTHDMSACATKLVLKRPIYFGSDVFTLGYLNAVYFDAGRFGIISSGCLMVELIVVKDNYMQKYTDKSSVENLWLVKD